MPKTCPDCRYSTTDEMADECPFCLCPLKARPRPRRLTHWVLIAACAALWAADPVYNYLATGRYVGPPQQADSTGRIRVGMPVTDLATALDPEFASTFPPGIADTGTAVWEKQGRILRITFRDRRVTSIEEGRVAVTNMERIAVSCPIFPWP